MSAFAAERVAARVLITKHLLETPVTAGGRFGLVVSPAAGEALQAAVIRVVTTLSQEERVLLRSCVDWVERYDLVAESVLFDLDDDYIGHRSMPMAA